MEEEWRTIQDAPRYDISEYGSVRNRETGRILKTSLSWNGYDIINLRVDGHSIGRRIHRLVAEAYLTPDPFREHVNHKDLNKHNNHYSNLEWTTPAENIQHAMDNDSFPRDHQSKAVRVLETGEVFISQSACARALGISQASISQVLLGHMGSARGYTFDWA